MTYVRYNDVINADCLKKVLQALSNSYDLTETICRVEVGDSYYDFDIKYLSLTTDDNGVNVITFEGPR